MPAGEMQAELCGRQLYYSGQTDWKPIVWFQVGKIIVKHSLQTNLDKYMNVWHLKKTNYEIMKKYARHFHFHLISKIHGHYEMEIRDVKIITFNI